MPHRRHRVRGRQRVARAGPPAPAGGGRRRRDDDAGALEHLQVLADGVGVQVHPVRQLGDGQAPARSQSLGHARRDGWARAAASSGVSPRGVRRGLQTISLLVTRQNIPACFSPSYSREKEDAPSGLRPGPQKTRGPTCPSSRSASRPRRTGGLIATAAIAAFAVTVVGLIAGFRAADSADATRTTMIADRTGHSASSAPAARRPSPSRPREDQMTLTDTTYANRVESVHLDMTENAVEHPRRARGGGTSAVRLRGRRPGDTQT